MKNCKAVVFFLLVTIISVFYLSYNKTPVFACEGSEYSFYILSNSSSAKVITVNGKSALATAKSVEGVRGESVFFDFNGIAKEYAFNFLIDFVDKKGAVLAFTEEGEWGVNYYLYTPKLNNSVVINNRAVNLHICINERGITAGYPLIFGSY
ncbi:MAG: hypothetical protein IJW13_04055 [Clostridia bacterium]|nr:hypothetical protein [Clostridia bacterium]